MKPDKIYIIHYTKLKDRYSNLISILEKSKIPFEFITQYDKEDLKEDILNKFYLPNPEKFTNKIKPLWDCNINTFRVLSSSELSCAIKQLTAIKKLSQECKNFGMILEDDIMFDTNFNLLFKKYIQETPNDWDAIFLGEGCGFEFQKYKLSTSIRKSENSYLVNNPATNCAEAYLLKPDIASKIYESSLPFQLAFDWELAYQLYKLKAKTYWWFPSIAKQGSRTGQYQSSLR